jgi:hypothetical protein
MGMYEKREVIQITDKGIAVVDRHTTLFGKPRFTAGVIVEEMRMVKICKTLGVYETRHEAATAASDAVTNGEQV